MTSNQIFYICRKICEPWIEKGFDFRFEIKNKETIYCKVNVKRKKYKEIDFELPIKDFLEDFENFHERKIIFENLIENSCEFLENTLGYSHNLTLPERISYLCSKSSGPCKFESESVLRNLPSYKIRGACHCPFDGTPCWEVTPEIVKEWLIKEVNR